MYDLRCTMYDGKAKRQERRFDKMIKISTDLNHHDHLRSLSQKSKKSRSVSRHSNLNAKTAKETQSRAKEILCETSISLFSALNYESGFKRRTSIKSKSRPAEQLQTS